MTPHFNSQGSAEAALHTRTDKNLGQVLHLLADNPMLVLSGTKIAEELSVSRSEVWRLIEQLREMGVKVAGHPSDGYQLEAVPDLLMEELLNPLIAGTIFARKVHHYFRIPSTNSSAMQAASAGEPEGTVFLAEEQTAGRGRGGHSWKSESSVGIYCSAILRPQMLPADVLAMSMMAGLAVVAAVQNVTGIAADLRWPNDVMLEDRKFCGILTELNAEATRVRHVVIGVGINVNQSLFPEELRTIATSLRQFSGREWSRVEVAAALLKSLDYEYREFLAAPARARQSILDRFEERSSYARGTRVHVDEEGGYDGITAGLDERGFLRVTTDGGMRTVLSGGVRKLNDTNAQPL